MHFWEINALICTAVSAFIFGSVHLFWLKVHVFPEKCILKNANALPLLSLSFSFSYTLRIEKKIKCIYKAVFGKMPGGGYFLESTRRMAKDRFLF